MRDKLRLFGFFEQREGWVNTIMLMLAWIVCSQQWDKIELFWGRIGCKVKIDSPYFRSLFLDSSNYLKWILSDSPFS